ncbi:hypothetical protein [Prevotella sp. E9-3]|nr:hypothetical protein [Prevotella sp. E9-3]
MAQAPQLCPEFLSDTLGEVVDGLDFKFEAMLKSDGGECLSSP